MTDLVMPFLTPILALAGILGLILLLGRAMRRMPLLRPASVPRTLAIKETLALDSRRRLFLVRHGDREVLLLTGGDSDLVVGWGDPGPPR